MMRLVLVELTRLRKRRAVLALMLLALVAPLVIAGSLAFATRPVSEAELQMAREQVTQELNSPDFKAMIRECAENPGDWGIEAEGADAEATCLQQNRPRVDWYLSRSPLNLEDQLVSGYLVLILVTALSMLAAATSIGHDWHTGSISNQLLFEPRRLRVFWAKALPVALMALLASALAMCIFWGTMTFLVQLRDIELPGGFIQTVLERSGRGMILASAAAVGTFAIANLFRSTVVTLGLMFALVVAGGIIVGLLPFPDHDRWQVANNVAAWVDGSARYYRDISEQCWSALDSGEAPPAGLDCRPEGVVTMWESARFLGPLLVAGLCLSAWSFRRRDVA